MLERVLFFTIALAALLSVPQFRLHNDGIWPSLVLCGLLVAMLVVKIMGWWPR